MTDRIVEAYVGEYAAGKSESAINRALEVVRQGRKVTLVDLDLVEPFYTLRPRCGLCVEKCPVDCIDWSDILGVYGTPSVKADNRCIACGICQNVCPDCG
ncbi:MAG: 4Fe-4S dicluster domain-containing protein [Desulfotomaculaceae bacterium]